MTAAPRDVAPAPAIPTRTPTPAAADPTLIGTEPDNQSTARQPTAGRLPSARGPWSNHGIALNSDLRTRATQSNSSTRVRSANKPLPEPPRPKTTPSHETHGMGLSWNNHANLLVAPEGYPLVLPVEAILEAPPLPPAWGDFHVQALLIMQSDDLLGCLSLTHDGICEGHGATPWDMSTVAPNVAPNMPRIATVCIEPIRTNKTRNRLFFHLVAGLFGLPRPSYWWPHRDSNPGPSGYEPPALTAEL